MAKKLFIAATEQNCGKTTVSLSLLHLARQKYRRVGFMKPLGPKVASLNGIVVDKDAALMCQVFGMEEDLPYMSPVVIHPDSTRKVLNGELDPAAMKETMLRAFAWLDQRCDFLIIEGSGHPGVGSVINLSNARVARLLGAKVLLITGGGVGSVIDAVAMNKVLFEKEGVEIRALLANKLLPEKRDSTLAYLRKAFAEEPFEVLGGFNYQPVLANPTLSRIAKILDLSMNGDPQGSNRIIHHVQIGAPSTQRVMELLRDDTLLIVTSSRDELLVTAANMYQIPAYRKKIAGLLIPGIQNISDITQQILDRCDVPYLRTTCHTTGKLYQIISADVHKIQAEDQEKIAMIRELAELRINFAELDALFS
ncbi:phosphotransacetylase family protein [Pelobacter seleniigenes]|uniref:phosphotransacetylase family protein n=1 Tax=Pelobacter seleniigenes TaxID=407188 RepID=UPI0004A7590E|nr:AAA family ATPase [Pelobacter seleniigenes]